MLMRITFAVLAAALACGLPASAQGDSAAAQLRASGAVGEQATGYMAPAPGASFSDAQRRAMNQINIQRRAMYTRKADETGSTVEQFSQLTACEIFKRLKPGDYYRDEENVWRKADANGVKFPSWCSL